MRRSPLAELARTPRVTVVELLKTRGPRTVRQLASSLKMSYMGVKAHCLDLERDGFVEGRRQPSKAGRPEIAYLLTPKGERLFVNTDTPLGMGLLDASARLFGPSAPEKLLFGLFQSQSAAYRDALPSGTIAERVARLVELRLRDGHYASVLEDDPTAWVEHHHPLAGLIERYPAIRRMEREMLERALGVKLRREGGESGTAYRCTYAVIPVAG